MVDLTVPNARVGATLDQWVQRNFEGEGELVGGWAPFARGGRWLVGVGLDTSAKLLQHTGRLRASFEPFWDKHEVGIGSDLSYAIYHEKGTSTIPRRRILPEWREVKTSVMKIYNEHIAKLSARSMW